MLLGHWEEIAALEPSGSQSCGERFAQYMFSQQTLLMEGAKAEWEWWGGSGRGNTPNPWNSHPLISWQYFFSLIAQQVKNLPASAGDTGDVVSIPGLGRSPGGGNGNPVQYSCLKNPMDRGAWQTTVWESYRVEQDWVMKHTQTKSEAIEKGSSEDVVGEI